MMGSDPLQLHLNAECLLVSCSDLKATTLLGKDISGEEVCSSHQVDRWRHTGVPDPQSIRVKASSESDFVVVGCNGKTVRLPISSRLGERIEVFSPCEGCLCCADNGVPGRLHDFGIPELQCSDDWRWNGTRLDLLGKVLKLSPAKPNTRVIGALLVAPASNAPSDLGGPAHGGPLNSVAAPSSTLPNLV